MRNETKTSAAMFDQPQLRLKRRPLSEASVIAIRESDELTRVLAKRYRRSVSAIANIRCGITHRDVGGPIREPLPPRLRSAKIDDDTAALIRKELGTPAEIGAKYGVCGRTVERVFKRRPRKA